MDTLEELPFEKWPTLQEKLRKRMPLKTVGYCTLSGNIRNHMAREAFQFKVYCPFGDMDNGFITIQFMGTAQCTIFTVTEDISKFEDALIKTKLIDWSKIYCLRIISSEVYVNKLATLSHFDRYYSEPTLTFYLDRNATPVKNLRCPANTFLDKVTEDHINLVNDTWRYKYPGSNLYLSALASYGLSYGLYSCSTKELLAWIFVNETTCLCNFFCKESYRKRGYGEFVLWYAVNDQLTDGNDVFAFVKEGNEKPLSILRSLGFKKVDECVLYLYGRKNIKCHF